ncbi:hypothetical protein HUN59_04145 [Curtobacterium sp. Csp2]|uniref:hypothetical protein n=1 Tax=Curtobacterium sp. Csp2 TaxID=2495430 RepID=UPI001580CB8E|nr:hypothetical protein [Curtobacterium sp. Csp2]QKS15514.1 hypothetical protein HUN59_04145 [Curtobacterium sp. Csp2]
MDSEPPKGDDLQRLLVTMKQDVLARATPRRGPRRRRTGIAIGVVAALLLGAAGGSVALGLIPGQDDRAAPPAATATPDPTPTRTPDGAPVVDSPPPTPTSTSTRPPYAVDDPRTWTISGSEVGPVALGGAVAAETDDLSTAFTDDGNCPNPNVSWWSADGRTPIIVVGQDGVVTGIAVGDFSADRPGPTTAEGLGVGSTLAELQAAYPDLTQVTGSDETPAWTIVRQGRHITFSMRPDTTVTGSVWVSDKATEPSEFCG